MLIALLTRIVDVGLVASKAQQDKGVSHRRRLIGEKIIVIASSQVNQKTSTSYAKYLQ